MAVLTQSPQYFKGRLAWNLRALATCNRCLCFLSTLPFCCGLSLQDVWCSIPSSETNFPQAPLINSKTLSDLMVLIVHSNCTLTNLRNYLRTEGASDLLTIRYVHVALLKSSTIVKKHLNFPLVATLYGPQVSIWTSSKGATWHL